MRNLRYSTLLTTILALAPFAAQAQFNTSGLSVQNYQLLSEQRISRTESQLTYRADLVNTGIPQPALTATVTSSVPSITVLPGLGNLQFGPVGTGQRTTSSNTFTVIVDRSGATDFSNLQWSYNAPVANAGPNQTVAVGQTVTLDGSGTTNPSGMGAVTYNWAFYSRPPGTRVVLQNSEGVSPSFVPDVPGDYILILTATNSAGSDSATVTISTVNSKPVADAGPNQTVKVGSTVFLSGAKSHDVDGNVLSYSWSLILKPSRSAATLTGANTVSPSFVADQQGTYTAQLIVTDANGTSDPSFVTINTSNTPPVANPGPSQSVTTGSVIQLDGSKSTDVDGDPLTYRWSLITVPAGSHATLSNPAIVNPTFTADVSGTYIAQLIVNDGTADSVPATVTISTNTTVAPTANAGPSQTLIHGSTVTLHGSGTDPQNLPLTFQWALISVPNGSKASLSSLTSANPTFVADLPGTYIAQLTVNNGTVSSTASTVQISSTDTAPVANAGPNQNVAVGSTITLDGSGSSDAESDTLTYSWSLLSKPAGSSASLLSANIVSPTFIADVAGMYVAQLIVSDGYLSSPPATVTITAGINAIGVSPNPLNVFNGTANLTVTIGSAAGPSGQVIKISILDPSVASAPNTVTIAPGATTALVGVTPVGIGTTTLLATAPGFQPGTTQVTVGQASIAVGLSSSSVGLTKSVTGTVTLSAGAPAGGIAVSLGADAPGLVNIPSVVNIGAGLTQGTFTATGISPGDVNITASFPGYTSGSSLLTVARLGAISVQPNLTVGAGQSSPIAITLISAAPSGGVTVSLNSSDPSKLTVTQTIFFSAGSTTPDTPAMVTGVNFGSASVTATAPGFTPDSKVVQVAVNLSLAPQVLTIAPSSSGSLTLTLSSPAPAGGVTVNLASDNTLSVTVPQSVSFAQGATSVNVPVTSINLGSANISANATVAGIAPGTARVNVISGVVISTSSLPAGVVGTPYGLTLGATGGTPPYTFTATGLPAGLTLSTSGQITGSPTASGPNSVTITATDTTSPTHLSGSTTLSLSVSGPLSITTTSLPGGTVGTAYSAQVASTGGTSPVTFTATGLPAGLSLSNSGAITGIPSAPGTASVTVTATDATAPTRVTATTTLSLAITPPLSVSTTSLPDGTVGVSYSQTLTAAGGNQPYTFTSSGLPAGLVLSASGAITGTPTTAGPVTVKVTVTDATSPTHLTTTVNLPLNINPPALVISTSSLPNGTIGIPYTTTVTAGGGTQPYTFSANNLPPGLTISPAGVISGTPTAVGPSTAAVTVTDTTSPTHFSTTANLAITINPPTLAVATTSLPGATVGVAYNASVAGTGGTQPYSFTATGLPNGLTISTTGNITGTPTASGPNTVSVTVTDAASPNHASATANLSLAVAPAPVVITTTSLPGGTVGAAYSVQVAASGGTPGYTFTGSNLPAGLTLSSSGLISGTPTAAGPSSVTINVSDNTNPTHLTTSATLNLTIVPPALVITTSSLPSGVNGSQYNATVTATGGTQPYVFTAAGLPAGLTLSTSGAITGTPTATGAFTAAITVTDNTSPSHYTNTVNLPITIAPPQLSITTSALPAGTAGVAYSATVAATGGTPGYTFTASGLPAGLSISTGGTISGTPSTSGPYQVSVTVTDSANPHVTASANLNLTIGTPALAISTANLPSGTVGVPYSASISATGGTQPYTFTSGPLPAGLTLSSTGAITGTPTAPGNTSFNVAVQDAANPRANATAALAINIAPPPLAITTTSLPSAMVGGSYSASIAATGGVAPYNFTATGLPAGLTLSTAGQITGSPTTSGPNSVTITVTDAAIPAHATATSTLNLFVAAPTLTITTSGLPAGTVGSPYSATLNATGGTQPFSWTLAAGQLPAGLSLNPNGTISGTPSSSGSSQPSFKVTDGGNPAQSATATFGLTINPAVVSGTALSVTGGTVGQGLQMQITISLAQASATDLFVTVATSDPSIVSVAGRSIDAGTGSQTVKVTAGSTSFSLFVQGIASSGSATITASASGYTSGSSTVSAAQSGFVINGPNGVGASATVSQGSKTTLTVSAAQLDPSGNFVQVQQLRGTGCTSNCVPGATVVVSDSNSGAGTVAPTTLNFGSGQDSLPVVFTAGQSAASALISLNVPSGFTTPANNANQLAVTVQPTGLTTSDATVGQGLETSGNVTLQGAAPNDLTVTLTSSDPSKLLLSPDAFSAGASSINLTVRAGHTATPDFYLYGEDKSGTVTYTASAPGFPIATGTVTLAPSGFVLEGPFGLGTDFPATTGAGPSFLNVYSAILDNMNKFVTEQAVAGGNPVAVTLTSGTTSVGSVTSPVTFNPGDSVESAQFQPLAVGTTLLSAIAPAGFTTPAALSTLTARVKSPTLGLNTFSGTVGLNLELQSSVSLGGNTAPAGGTQVTLTSDNAGALFSATPTGTGSASLVLTVPAGQTAATFYIYGVNSFGTADITATASGYASNTAPVTLAPSGIVIGADQAGFPLNITLAGGPVPVKVSSAVLDGSGYFVMTQPLAGSASLSVSVTGNADSTGKPSSPVTIAGGTDTAISTFTPLAKGTVVISVHRPVSGGYSTPSNDTSLTINIK